MNVVYNVKISVNGKDFYVSESKDKSVETELFEGFIKIGKNFSINDDGSKYKNQLKKFDVSKEKQFGNMWTFKANKNSIPFLIKVIKQYTNWGHLRWKLEGESFSISYEECGDEKYYEDFMNDGPSGKSTISKVIKIKIDKELLPRLNIVLDNYSKIQW